MSGSFASLELASLDSASLVSVSVESARAHAVGCVGAEIIADHAALTYQMKPRDLEEAAEKACKLKASEINTIFPDVSAHCQPALTCNKRSTWTCCKIKAMSSQDTSRVDYRCDEFQHKGRLTCVQSDLTQLRRAVSSHSCIGSYMRKYTQDLNLLAASYI